MKPLHILLFFVISSIANAQNQEYEPNDQHPYGRLNPSATTAAGDFGPMIGICDCISVNRNPDGSWQDSLKMEWRFKYIMNGTAVQDEVWRQNGMMAGSLRQYNADSAKWYVSYYSNTNIPSSLPAWSGAKKEDGSIVLYKDQQAPNGIEGFSRLTFHNISAVGFDWKGEWVSKDESIVYPFWTISCKKRNE